MPDGIGIRGVRPGFPRRIPRFPRRRFPVFPRRRFPFIFPIVIGGGFPRYDGCYYIDRYGRCCDRWGRCYWPGGGPAGASVPAIAGMEYGWPAEYDDWYDDWDDDWDDD